MKVLRSVGLFGEVRLKWQALGHPPSQVTPSNGILTFEEYDKEKTFDIRVVKDELPELAMNVTLQLEVISGEK